ncbi:transposase family protein [Planctomycetales bacterium ZRK34]|nr:transposase family protein [Planctomycetales bacterium ZRK34]
MTNAARKSAYSGAAPSHIDWADWVHINEAADLLKIDEGRLRTMCANELGPRAHAAKMNPPSGGKATWFVHRSYDPRLQNNIVEDDFDPSDFTMKQVAIMQAKKECVMRLRELRQNPNVQLNRAIKPLLIQLRATVGARLKDQFNFKIGISKTRLYEWDGDYSRDGLAGLCDNRGGDRFDDGDEAAWDYFRGLVLHENKLKDKTAWQNTRDRAEQEGWAWISYPQFLRRVKQRIPNVVRLAACDKAATRNCAEPRQTMPIDLFDANEVWMGDHAQADVWVTAPGYDKPVRPWISARMDWRTETITGYVVTLKPDSTCIAAALRAGIDNPDMLGPPAIVWDDNGKDYRSVQLVGGKISKRTVIRKGSIDESLCRGLYDMLDIKPHFAIPHNPTGKSRLELWFKNRLHNRFDRQFFTSYCGTNTLQRPEGLIDAMKRGQLITLKEYCDRLVVPLAPAT